MGSEEYISEIHGKFSIDRIFNDKKYNFGIFDTYDEALEKLDYLEEEGWPFSRNEVIGGEVNDKSGLSLSNIEEIDGAFIVFKYIMDEKVIFGQYDSLDEAKYIRKNLIDNAWESTEPNTRSKYGKYIQEDNGKFIVKRVYKGVHHSFGSFKTLDEALKCREDLVSTNWGDLNITLEMKKGKYISYNGIMYTIQRMINGSINVYGYFNELESAIEQRDWLIAHGWSRLEVPDDSRRHIHKRGDEYIVYKRSHSDIEYFGTFNSLDEAKYARNKLIENDWVLEDSNEDMEIISDFVYFDGEFYIIKKEVDGQNRIYGVYKNKNQALSDEKLLINNEWDGIYAIPTKEYPYGENIVPFDYIFILEEFDDGIKEEVGTYYSFKDAVIAREELFDKNDSKKDRLTFSVKVGKSYKNRGWSIIRDTTYDLIPKLPYEDECDIIVDGIPTTAKLNLLPRIFYSKTNKVVNHLEKLAKSDPNGRIDVQLMLNKNNPFEGSKNEIKSLNAEIKELNNEILNLNHDIEELNDENNSYSKRFKDLNKLIKELNDIDIDVDELNGISDLILRIKIFDMISIIDSLNEKMEN